MFCFPLTLTHGSSLCIRVHFSSHISVKFDFMRVVYYTFVIIVTLIIVVIMSFMSVARASSVRLIFFVFLCSLSFTMELL